MKKSNIAEKQLFHGTDPKHIDAICHNNLDWRICGTHGTAYGKGDWPLIIYKSFYTFSPETLYFIELVFVGMTKLYRQPCKRFWRKMNVDI